VKRLAMDEIKEELKSCNTLNEVFDVLDKHYDLDQRIGYIGKTLLVNSVRKIILATGAKKREWQEKEQS